MKNSNDLRVRRTRTLLTQALLSLMKKKPFEKITITDICEKAMVHRTTFYAHFEDKYDLLRQTMSQFEEPFDSLEIKELSFDGYKNYYMDVAENIFKYVFENRDMFKLLIEKNKHESFISFFRKSLTEKLEEELTRCQKSGIDIGVPIPVLANLYMGGGISVMLWWIENDIPCSSEKLIEYLDAIIQPVLRKAQKEE